MTFELFELYIWLELSLYYKWNKIHNVQLLLEDTQYFQYCNNVKLHAVQCTSTKFLTTARFNNKGLTSIHKSLQKLEFHKPIFWHVRESETLLKCTATTYDWWSELKKLVIVKITLIGLLMTILTHSDYGIRQSPRVHYRRWTGGHDDIWGGCLPIQPSRQSSLCAETHDDGMYRASIASRGKNELNGNFKTFVTFLPVTCPRIWMAADL